ncbi:cobyric acid synthase [Thalassospira sp.]|uniref:cobyric acid synthase n=1 Tax=Thalassospira sp. TaxID=1912094 RepID=UPI002732C59A|nr:cobyric acid synthase [Thalassospira sp.]MDP2699400.1 cobyric acid synthase [Thalassospira sp.]
MTTRPVPALMLQGTGSDVGKSLLVAGLCRAFVRRGLRVMPFKPQNMSNNAAVTADGGEIGRAQALQARAAGVPTSVHMNPVLLKPQSDTGSQVVVQGKVLTTARARDYYRLKRDLLPRVIDSFDIIGRDADLVIVEGAGSAAEVNLRDADIANMGFAAATGTPVVLVGDIDRGGVIAAIVGTHLLLPPSDRHWLRGYIINRFRGDVSLFEPALGIIENHCGLKNYGIVTYWPDAARLPAEDSVALEKSGGKDGRYRGKADISAGRTIRIAVLLFPRIANFDDLDPLAAEPDVDLILIRAGDVIPGDCDLILLPGSKSTRADLKFLKDQGWHHDIIAHWRRGGHVMGICGGYQMLGHVVADPYGIEGDPGDEAGLGLLDVRTIMAGDKTLRQRAATVRAGSGCVVASGTALQGYEIHMGDTGGPDRTRAWIDLGAKESADGAISADGRVMGGYLHGLFAADDFRRGYLAAISGAESAHDLNFEAGIEATLDGLADHVEACLDLDALWNLAQQRGTLSFNTP